MCQMKSVRIGQMESLGGVDTAGRIWEINLVRLLVGQILAAHPFLLAACQPSIFGKKTMVKSSASLKTRKDNS